MTDADSEDRESPARTAESVARRSYGKLVALLSARSRDLAAAEDALSEAFVAALTAWPRDGCPANPEAWLLTAARRKRIDAARRARREGPSLEEGVDASAETLLSAIGAEPHQPEIPDHRLGLMFACAHPAIDAAARAPLILQLVLGLTAETIASAFLVSPATMGQRLVRAKTKIHAAGIPLRVPESEELPGRLDTVLEAIYAAFTEGWSKPGRSAAANPDERQSALAEEAIFLGRLVVELLPREPEGLGLLALMLHADARRRARRTSDGEYVPLDEQDCSLWNWRAIEEAEGLIRRAGPLGRLGCYQLEAALQSAHVHRLATGASNWPDIVSLYDALGAITRSPVVAVNRLLAVAETEGAKAALERLEELAADPRLSSYQPYWAVRAELLSRVGDRGEAHRAYELAIGLEVDPVVRRFLLGRQADLQKRNEARQP